MARRKKKVKIRHVKSIYKKRRTKGQKIFSIILTFVIIIGLAILGYSIGQPVLDFFNNRQNSSDDTSSSVWTPPTTSSETTTVSDDVEDTNDNEQVKIDFTAYSLPLEAVLSEDALNSSLLSAKNNGYTSVIVTLKADGGEIYYASESQIAKLADAIVGTLPASTIAQKIDENGLTPIAKISVLKDHIVPRNNKDLSYTFENEETIWLDNSPSNGGKAWMSPFSEQSKSYISDITNEVLKAGFTKIIASDIVFPPFRNSDLNYIGTLVKDENRYQALVSMTNTMKTNVDEYNGELFVEVSILEVLTGESEVFVPNELQQIDFITQINISQIPDKITLKDSTVLDLTGLGTYDKIKAVLIKINEYADGSFIIPNIIRSEMSEDDYNEVLRAFQDLGYNTYIVE